MQDAGPSPGANADLEPGDGVPKLRSSGTSTACVCTVWGCKDAIEICSSGPQLHHGAKLLEA